MKIQLHEITVRELVEGYEDDGHDGVRGFGGALDIRPASASSFTWASSARR